MATAPEQMTRMMARLQAGDNPFIRLVVTVPGYYWGPYLDELFGVDGWEVAENPLPKMVIVRVPVAWFNREEKTA